MTRSANGQIQTATLNCEISSMREKKQRKTPQKICRLLMGSEQVMKTKNLQAMMMIIIIIIIIMMMMMITMVFSNILDIYKITTI
jgi:hypothetical protein